MSFSPGSSVDSSLRLTYPGSKPKGVSTGASASESLLARGEFHCPRKLFLLFFGASELLLASDVSFHLSLKSE